jgi:Amt family ammonium transporter
MFGSDALAQTASTADLVKGINTVWVLISAFLVFFMQAGFAFLEAGSTHEKNTVSILMKNLIDFSIATVSFWLVGYAFMFGSGNNWIGLDSFFLFGLDSNGSPAEAEVAPLALWLFQLVFAGTAATIVSGAMAERTKFSVYLLTSVIMTAIIYPIFGHWVWGEGWLHDMGFHDFAGSTVVHSVGGWAALVGALLLGPRIGRFDSEHAESFRGQSVPFATLGVFILWLAWFGFNPGSQLAAVGPNADAIALVAANTNLAAAAGAVGSLLLVRLRRGQWRLTSTLNGVLGGLVAVTAPCNLVDQFGAFVIGLIGGLVVTLATWLLEARKIDDPVGAVPVHLAAGIWGTLSVGIFGVENGLVYGGGVQQLLVQGVGVLACALWTVSLSFVAFSAIQHTIGLRVASDVEEQGLDAVEHGETGYSRIRDSVEDTPSTKLPSLGNRGDLLSG